MRRKRVRRAYAALAVLVLVSATAVVAGYMTSGTSAQAVGAGEGEFPTALGRHLEQLAKTYPGNQGLSEEGPASSAESAFLERAYPADTISVEQMAGVRSAVAAAKGRPFPSGKGRKGTWVSVGPSEALYPFERFRNAFNYVPNAYVAGGRTTSIALAASCKPGDCRAYITAAGGGVWRTKNALTGEPHWEYLGGPLGINAAGAVYLDPERREREHRLRRHRRGEHLRLGLCRRDRPLQVDRRRGDAGRCSAEAPSTASGSARSSSSRAARTRSTPG